MQQYERKVFEPYRCLGWTTLRRAYNPTSTIDTSLTGTPCLRSYCSHDPLQSSGRTSVLTVPKVLTSFKAALAGPNRLRSDLSLVGYITHRVLGP